MGPDVWPPVAQGLHSLQQHASSHQAASRQLAEECHETTASVPARDTAIAHAAVQGTWSVVGHSGSIAIHISMSPTNELLFFERPHITGGYVGQNPYLTVRPALAAPEAQQEQGLVQACMCSSFWAQAHQV